MYGDTLILPNPQSVAEHAAWNFISALERCHNERFSLALSGGSTPQRFYRLLTEDPWRGKVNWQKLHVFLADERLVPADDPDSNDRMIRQTLVEPLNACPSPDGGQLLPPSQIHTMPTDGTAEDCASRHEAELKAFFGDTPPRFDMMVLGMGPDGHTASLFPGHTHPQGPWVLPVYDSPKPPPTRLSLSLEVINQAHRVLFLVTGHDKAAALRALRESDTHGMPAGLVNPQGGNLLWLVDRAAEGTA